MLDALRKIGTGRLVIIGVVIIGFIGFFYFLTTRLTAPNMGLLFAGLDPADSGKIVAKLDAISVPYELKGNGTQILVPSDQVARLRMTVAKEGLPSGGTMGYELFDRSDSLGTSNFVLNIHRLRALEGELARSIGSLSYVRRARVHLVLPRRELFSRNAPKASASVVLQMQGGRRLVKGEVAAIQQLVAAAVLKLQPSNITIIDGQGTLLARGRAKGGGGTDEPVGGDGRKQAFEAQLARTIEEILERTVGGGRVRAEVTADMDFDRVSTTTESFDPDGQVVRSTQSVEETSAAKDSQGSSNPPVSVANSLPSSNPQGNTGSQTSNSNNSNRTEETVNYEISKTTRTHIRESGTIKKISVAVLVDGSYVTDADNNRTYKPRTTEEMAELKKLVETGIGFNPKRGDKVEVVNLKFAKGEQVLEEEPRPLFGFGKNDYMRMAELSILAIVSILVILLVIRPLIKRVLDALPDAIASSKNLIEESVAAAGSHSGALPPASHDGAMALPNATAPGNDTSPSIDMDAVEDRVRDSTMKRIGEIVEKHPDEAVNIIRNWMYQES